MVCLLWVDVSWWPWHGIPLFSNFQQIMRTLFGHSKSKSNELPPPPAFNWHTEAKKHSNNNLKMKKYTNLEISTCHILTQSVCQYFLVSGELQTYQSGDSKKIQCGPSLHKQKNLPFMQSVIDASLCTTFLFIPLSRPYTLHGISSCSQGFPNPQGHLATMKGKTFAPQAKFCLCCLFMPLAENLEHCSNGSPLPGKSKSWWAHCINSFPYRTDNTITFPLLF